MPMLPDDPDLNDHLDESEDEMKVVLPDSDDGTDEDNEQDVDDEDESEDEHVRPRIRHGFFDMEALDSDDQATESEEDEDEDHEEDHESDEDDGKELHFFPQFKRLPIELRFKVWEKFCPELTADARVYEPPFGDNAFAEMVLVNQTMASRAILAVHRESREFALKSFPDTLTLDICGRRQCVLRFRKERDLIVLSRAGGGSLRQKTPGFFDQICNLAINLQWFSFQDEIPQPASDAFPLLNNLFFLVEHSFCSAVSLRWCASDKVRLSPVTCFYETLEGNIKQSYKEMYCWPDVENHRDHAEQEIPLDLMWRIVQLPNYPDNEEHPNMDDYSESGDYSAAVTTQLSKLPIWPLVQFNSSGIARLSRMQAWSGEEEDWDGSSSFSKSDRPEEPDEYESSGLDDEEIEEVISEEEDDLVVYGDEESVENQSDSEAPGFEGFSPLHQNGTIDLTEDVAIPDARFSSPEPESATVSAESNGSDSDEPVRRTASKSSRKRVIESDDDEPEEVPRKRARFVNRVEDSDDEDDEQDEVVRKPSRPVAQEDTESEDESEEEEEDESEEEESGDESEEDAPAKPMSLAEKLQLHRQRNPIPDDDDGEEEEENPDSEMEEMGGDGYDAGDYAEFQDDEEGQDSEDDDGDRRNGFAVDFDETGHGDENEEN